MNNKKLKSGNLGEKWDLTIAAIVILLAAFFVYDKVFSDSGIINDEVAKSEVNRENNAVSMLEEIQIGEENEIDFITTKDSSIISNEVEVEEKRKKRSEVLKFDAPPVFENYKIEKKHDAFEKPLKDEHKDVLLKSSNIESSEIIDESISSSEIQHNNQTELKKIIEQDTPVESEVVEGDIQQNLREKKSNAKITESRINRNFDEDIEHDCTVVIGVFRDQANKNNIINKLTELGYSSNYGVMKNGLSFVGVPTSCNDKVDNQKIMHKLNAEFNVETWVRNN